MRFAEFSLLAGILLIMTAEPIWASEMEGSALARNPVLSEMMEKLNEREIYNTIEMLQNYATRQYGTDDNANAACYLFNKLSVIPGLKVEYQGGSLKNIIATMPGIDNSSDEIIIVGAHYDSISSDPGLAPGATDNACGVAIVLELAKIMSQFRFNHTIAFALWNDEEGGCKGSSKYVEYATGNSLEIPLYFNFDSSCYDPNSRFILDIMHNNQSSWAKEMMAQDNTLYGINFTLTSNNYTCNSDHESFWSNGYPALMTHSEHGPDGSADDTIDNVSMEYALKNGRIGMILIGQVAGVVDQVTLQ